MATPEQVATLRRMADEPGTETYTDEQLSATIDGEESVEAAAAAIWWEKAAKASTLVNISESGSSRAMQQVHANALAMARMWDEKATSGVDVVTGDSPFVVGIERA